MTIREDESRPWETLSRVGGARTLRYGTVFIIVPVWRKKGVARCGVTCLQHERKGEGRTGKSRLARVRLVLG